MLDSTVGWRFVRHGFLTLNRGPKTCRVYDLQRKLTLEDWELLAGMTTDNYDKGQGWVPDDRSKVKRLAFYLAR